MDIKWEEPDATRRGNGEYAALADALKARPGEWALVSENSHASVTGHLKRRYGLEAVARETKDGRAKIYARFVEQSASKK